MVYRNFPLEPFKMRINYEQSKHISYILKQDDLSPFNGIMYLGRTKYGGDIKYYGDGESLILWQNLPEIKFTKYVKVLKQK